MLILSAGAPSSSFRSLERQGGSSGIQNPRPVSPKNGETTVGHPRLLTIVILSERAGSLANRLESRGTPSVTSNCEPLGLEPGPPTVCQRKVEVGVFRLRNGFATAKPSLRS